MHVLFYQLQPRLVRISCEDSDYFWHSVDKTVKELVQGMDPDRRQGSLSKGTLSSCGSENV